MLILMLTERRPIPKTAGTDPAQEDEFLKRHGGRLPCLVSLLMETLFDLPNILRDLLRRAKDRLIAR